MSPRLRASSCVWLALCGCIPDEPPEWVVTQPITWGYQSTVVEPGPYSAGLLVPLGQTRAEALLLDTLELRWFFAAPPEAVVRSPIWILCPGYECPIQGLMGVELPDCPVPLPASDTLLCRLGVGVRQRVTFGELDPRSPGALVMTVASWGEIDPETCLQRLSREPLEGLEQCLIGQRAVQFGPRSRIAVLFPELFPGAATEALIEEPPDTNPVIVWFSVVRGADPEAQPQLARDGETVEVRAGEMVTVTLQFNANAEESYYSWRITEAGVSVLDVGREMLRASAMLTREVEGYEAAEEYAGRFVYRWIAPEGPEPVTLFVAAGDGRQGRAFASLHLRSLDAAGGAP